MQHKTLSSLKLATVVCVFLGLTGAATADKPGRWSWHRFIHGPPGLDPWRHTPGHFGYNLDDMTAGYYGGGRYQEYYNYGRGYGIANYPGPLAGPGLPPDYRGSFRNRIPSDVSAIPLVLPHESTIPAGSAVAHLAVEVPAGAQVWMGGGKTQQSGTSRSFVSPVLPPGRDFVYEVRARWEENGKAVDQTQEVVVRAGDRVEVKFPVGPKPELLPVPNRLPLDRE